MFGLSKRKFVFIGIALIAVLGISQTEIPSGGMNILNSAGTAVIEFFDTGDAEFTGYIDADEYKQDGVTYDLAALGGGSKHTIQDDGVDMTDRAKLNISGTGVTVTDNAGANSTDVVISTGGMTDSEVETAYNNQVAVVSQAEAEAGISTTVKRWTPERVAQAIAALSGGGGTTEFSDDTFKIKDNLDPTKIVEFSLGGITTGTTRTLTVPNASGTLALTSDLHSAVTLSGSYDYITLSGQDLIRGQIDLGTDVTGTLADGSVSDTLTASKVVGSGSTSDAVDAATAEFGGNIPVARFNSGTGASSSTFWRGDGSWATPTGDPTYGSDAGASDDAVYVDAENDLGIGTTVADSPIHIYTTNRPPRALYQYYNPSASDVTQYPSAATDTGTGQSWLNTGNLYADDGVYAQVGLGIGSSPWESKTLQVTGLSFSIPSGATIVGVEVELQAKNSDAGEASDVGAYLIVGGTVITGYNKATSTTLPTTDTIITYGGPTDPWGEVLAAEANASNFGFAWDLSSTDSSIASVDYIKITIYYTESATGDYVWSSGVDIIDGAWTIRGNAVDLMRMNYTDGEAIFTGVVDADGYKQDGVLYDLSTFSTGSGDVEGPASSTDYAIPLFDGTTGKLLRNSTLVSDAAGNLAVGSGDTIDGRDVSVDGSKLDGIETGATADQTNAEIETAYNAQVGIVSQATAEAGSSTTAERWTAQRVRQAAEAVDFSFSGDLTGTVTNFGSGVSATIANDAVTVDKMSNATEYTLLGRNASGTGNRGDIAAADAVVMMGAAYADGEVVDLGTVTTSVVCDYDPDRFYIYTATLSEPATVTTSGSTLAVGNKFILILTQDGSGGNTVDFSNTYFMFSTDIPEPTIPTTAASKSIYMFMYIGGGKYSLLAYNQGF